MSRGQKRERTLTKELSVFLSKMLLPDLRSRAAASAIAAVLRQRWEHERAEERTAEPYEEWVDQLIEQVGAAWILSCVFVRTLEDRDLVARRRLAGEGAADSEHYFYELAPSLNARDYLLTIFKELSRFPGTEPLLGPKGNAAWRLAPSGPVAQALLEFFRETREDGTLRWTFGVPASPAGPERSEPARASGVEGRAAESSTRFLGDLYQDLSESVRERYALLQTPDFVERFILRLTLDPAIQEFGLEEVRVIDPTCGSGHFLLGAYDRLFEARLAAQPGLDRRQHALAALDQVYGADINPYAVAVARFRLTLAFLEKAGLTRLADAPKLPSNLVVADSLVFGARGANREFSELATSKKEWGDALFTLEEPDRAVEVLSRGYHVVVGNPPYITCKDATLRRRYGEQYASCAMNYSLAVPFTERFFQLAAPAAWVGMINPNSFAKREFGKALISKVLPRLDLQRVLDTSGAYIPGHGTPTVILLGRNRPPSGDAVRVVMGRRGEPSTPANAEAGHVWSAIREHFDELGFEDDFISVADVERNVLSAHPWSLGGGGASELKRELERRASSRLSQVVDDVGFAAIIGEDDAFLRPAGRAHWAALPRRPAIIGEGVRDWAMSVDEDLLFPFQGSDLQPVASSGIVRELWPLKRLLEERVVSGSTTMKEAGRAWFDLRRLSREKLRSPLSIAFAFVATHNHFVLDRGGKVFNRSAPIIKLPDGATEEDHLALLGYLNSSTACFWMKQTFFDKGNRGEGGGLTSEKWEKFFEHDGTKLATLPLPPASERTTHFARLLDEAGAAWAALDPHLLGGVEELTTAALEHGRQERARLEGRMRWLQEELDWDCYALVGLPSATIRDIPRALAEVPQRAIGSRPSDVLYARQVLAGEYTDRFFALCAMPSAQVIATQTVAELDARRIEVIRRSKELQLIETPVYKRTFRESHRPWNPRPAVHSWLLRKIESAVSAWSPSSGPLSLRAVVTRVHAEAEPELLQQAGITDPADLAALVQDGGVPFLCAMRFTSTGDAKHAVWHRTWDLQRREDAGDAVGEIPVPPKYDQKDYREPTYWRLRGKLDVPKERFISYPGAERDDDKSPLIGWAGWDHLQRAQALAALYQERKNQDGWEKERLRPLLAGLLELVPWLKQWHSAPNEDPGKDRAGDAYASFVDAEARALGYTLEDLRAWRPEEKRGRRTLALRQAQRERTGGPAQGERVAEREVAEPTADAAAPAPKKPRKRKTNKTEEAAE